MNKLPEDILSSILSLLPLNEVARSALVCRQWRHHWRHIHVLNFDNPIAFEKMADESVKKFRIYSKIIHNGRCNFVNWVNNVVNNHLGCILYEFNLVFYLNDVHQHVIDGWVSWAFSKNVERLKLDFSPTLFTHGVIDPEKHQYVLDLPMLESCDTKFHLTSLCLKSVNVTNQAMECLLNNCGPTLDYLWIKKCYVLTRIGGASLPCLKYLKIFKCPDLEVVDIGAPKLVTFKYYSCPPSAMKLLNIENASALSRVSIRVHDYDNKCILYVLCCLYKYFPQLEYLKLAWLQTIPASTIFGNFPVLGNLKHLKVFACIAKGMTLDAWVPFIGACPLLQKLTLDLRGRVLPVWPKNLNHRCPLLHLKTLEIRAFNGVNVDSDIVNFVFQNAAALEEVIIYPGQAPLIPLKLEAPLAGVGLTIPPHVKVVVV